MDFNFLRKKNRVLDKITQREPATFERRELDDLDKFMGTDRTPSKSFPDPLFDSGAEKPLVSTQTEQATQLKYPDPELSYAFPETRTEILEMRREIRSDEVPLKELCGNIQTDLRDLRSKSKKLQKTENITLESPEMVDLLDLYLEGKEKMNKFTEQINKLNFNLDIDKTVAAIYKFRACKSLAEMKREIQKLEEISRKAGFVPGKINDILRARAEELVDDFLVERKDEF